MEEAVKWDLMPPERHYANPWQLINDIGKFRLSGNHNWQNNPGLTPPEGKFEIVNASIEGNNRIFLWPTANDYAFLYRGQGTHYNPSFPSLYRKKLTREELFLNLVKITDFILLMRQFPQVHHFRDLGLNIDAVGLSQHYGFDTDVMDLTSDPEIALFFAMCDWDKDTDTYSPKTENKTHIGYLYAYPYFGHLMTVGNESDMFKVRPIGLQPFDRPGTQKGFSIHLRPGESFKGLIYSFEYTKEDSQSIFDRFKHIFSPDRLSVKAKEIRESTRVSWNALKYAADDSESIFGRKLTKSKASRIVNDYGLKITSRPEWVLGKAELEEIFNEYAVDIAPSILSSLVKRSTSQGKCVDFDFISQETMLRIFRSGCPSNEGYDSGIEFSNNHEQKYSRIGFRYGRPQTEPNPRTLKIDKWDGLDWSGYAFPNDTNRFKGYFPEMKLVRVKKHQTGNTTEYQPLGKESKTSQL